MCLFCISSTAYPKKNYKISIKNNRDITIPVICKINPIGEYANNTMLMKIYNEEVKPIEKESRLAPV